MGKMVGESGNSSSVQEIILHCQKQIKKNTGEEKLLHYIGRLRRLRIKVKDLVDTGIGRTVNQLSRQEGKVGQQALDLVAEWKALVEAEEKEKSSSEASESSSHEEEEEEHDDDRDDEDEGALRIIDNPEVDETDDESEAEPDNPLIKSEPHSSDEEISSPSRSSRNGTSSPPRSISRNGTSSPPRSISRNGTSSPSRSTSRNGPSSSVDPNIKVKVSEGRKSESHRDREKSKHKERKKEESRSSSKTKDDKTHRHSHGHSHSHDERKSKHRHKSDERSSSKRKNDEELLKPETDVKKVKLEPKSEKQKNPRQLLPTLSVEIDSTSGVNFADVLSCMDQKVSSSSSSSKKKDKPRTNGSSTSSSKSSSKASGSDPYVSSKSKRTAREDKRHGSKNGVSSSKDRDKDNKTPKPKSVILPTYSLSSASTAMISPNYKPSAVGRIMAVAPMPVPKASTSVPPREILNSLRQDYQGVSGYPTFEGENRLDYDRRTTEDALSTMISSRNQRTKVYSGVKSGVVGAMPKLFDLCIRVIQENINDLGFTGGVPYDILKPVLDRATADQLLHVENYNPYLIEYTDGMWKFHCSKDFRGQKPQELESWRELYTRLVDERKARFHTLTNKVKRTQETAIPQMKAKLAYVDTTSGPRFHKSKADTIKNGMKTLKTREEKGIKRTHGSSASAGGSGSSQNVTIEEASVIISANSRAGSAPASASREPRESTAAKKPKKAPLMQKTLKVIKTLFRR